MKKLLHEFWTSWQTWVFLGCLLCIIIGATWMTMTSQRGAFERSTDAATIRTIHDIKEEIKRLKEESEVLKSQANRSDADRAIMRKDQATIRREMSEVKKKG